MSTFYIPKLNVVVHGDDLIPIPSKAGEAAPERHALASHPKPGRQINARLHWSADEDRTLLETMHLSATRVARQLGRSPKAIYLRRTIVRKMAANEARRQAALAAQQAQEAK